MRTILVRLSVWGVLVSSVLLSGLCVAHASKPDPYEAVWGVNGAPMVEIFHVTVNNNIWPDLAIGNLRNVSAQPLENIVVTVGDHEKGDTIIYGTDSLKDVSLDPNEVWRWSVDASKGTGYVVLGISVNGQKLSKMSPP